MRHLAAQTPVIPAVVAGRYRITELLAAGGSATVWLARDQVLARRVALKQVGAPGPKCAARALREARASARAAHPNIVRVYDVITDAGDYAWIVMEALTGVSLAAQTAREGPLPVASVHRVAEGLLAALETLHTAGVVHRDVKPSNVHLGLDGRVVLTDFGVAAPLERGRSGNDLLAGTFGYIAPESVLDGVYSAASDMYGLGATLFYAMQGRQPFDIRTIEDLVEHACIPSQLPPLDRAGRLEPMITGLLRPRVADRWRASHAREHLREHGPRRARLALHDRRHPAYDPAVA